jgi:hypothetical protein
VIDAARLQSSRVAERVYRAASAQIEHVRQAIFDALTGNVRSRTWGVALLVLGVLVGLVANIVSATR